MNDAQQRPIYTPTTIPVQPPGESYLNVMKVPLVVERPSRWPIYFLIGAVILVALAVIPFLIPDVGTYLRAFFSKDPVTETGSTQQSQSEAPQTLRTARVLALKAVIEAEGPDRVRARAQTFSIVDTRTVTTGYGWIFFWNTKRFIQTGDIKDSIPGNGPVVVTKKGEVEILKNNLPPGEAILEYEVRVGVRQVVTNPTATSTSATTTVSTATTTATTTRLQLATTTATTTARAIAPR